MSHYVCTTIACSSKLVLISLGGVCTRLGMNIFKTQYQAHTQIPPSKTRPKSPLCFNKNDLNCLSLTIIPQTIVKISNKWTQIQSCERVGWDDGRYYIQAQKSETHLIAAPQRRPSHAGPWSAPHVRHGFGSGSDHSHQRQVQPAPHPDLHHQRLLRPRHRILHRVARLPLRRLRLRLRLRASRRHPPPLLLRHHSRPPSLLPLLLALKNLSPQKGSWFLPCGESLGAFQTPTGHELCDCLYENKIMIDDDVTINVVIGHLLCVCGTGAPHKVAVLVVGLSWFFVTLFPWPLVRGNTERDFDKLMLLSSINVHHMFGIGVC